MKNIKSIQEIYLETINLHTYCMLFIYIKFNKLVKKKKDAIIYSQEELNTFSDTSLVVVI